MINPILMAAARGARIQVLCDDWEEDRCVMVWDLQQPQQDYRIHPDDMHLMYGPISSALREASTVPYIESKQLPHFLSAIAIDYYAQPWVGYDSDLHRALFLLILAEELMYEGL